jgi:Fic family protein
MAERKALLDHLGGLPETIVENTEWLYMLEEETRHSLSIEGYFATEQELRAILRGRKTEPEILNYFRMAQVSYDLALQYYREKQALRLDLPFLRHIHSELFRELSPRRGEFRRGAIQIQGAKVKPPTFDVEQYVRSFCQISQDLMKSQSLLPALARVHTLFESIHPFEDGNGRVGRILLNCLTVNQGYPPIVIKGIRKEERQRYYQALETADVGFHQGFSSTDQQQIRKQLEQGNFQSLEMLLSEGLQPRMDRLIATVFQKQAPLLEFKELAPQMGVKEGTLRQWVNRGKLIAIKKGNKLYSHPQLYLEARRK